MGDCYSKLEGYPGQLLLRNVKTSFTNSSGTFGNEALKNMVATQSPKYFKENVSDPADLKKLVLGKLLINLWDDNKALQTPEVTQQLKFLCLLEKIIARQFMTHHG